MVTPVFRPGVLNLIWFWNSNDLEVVTDLLEQFLPNRGWQDLYQKSPLAHSHSHKPHRIFRTTEDRFLRVSSTTRLEFRECVRPTVRRDVCAGIKPQPIAFWRIYTIWHLCPNSGLFVYVSGLERRARATTSTQSSQGRWEENGNEASNYSSW